MPYRLFITHLPLPSNVSEPNYASMIAVEVPSEVTALDKAIAEMKVGHVVWRIEGPNSQILDREAIRRVFFERVGRWPK